MDDFFLKKQQLFHSVESITFIWFIIITTAVIVIYCYGRYRKLKIDSAIQMKMFNRDIFLRDRQFFEKFGAKKELLRKDFLEMYADNAFREHLWRKEMEYYKSLVQIVEGLRLIRFYEVLAIVIFLGILILEVFFMVMPFTRS